MEIFHLLVEDEQYANTSIIFIMTHFSLLLFNRSKMLKMW
jgi:hypothetical protein